jgi:hypothetical protein
MFSFIGAFFILAPIILFYTSGYRLDLKRYQILKTGTLFIEAKDISKADIYLNDEKLPELFSGKKYIYNLLPGEYQVKLAREGYHDWQKKAVIYSGLTTFIKDAILFKNEVPLQVIEEQITDFSPSPDWGKFVYVTKKDAFEEIYLYNFTDKQKTLIYRRASDNTLSNISWAASSKKILLSYGSNFIIIDAQNPKNNYSLKNYLDFTPTLIQWDISSDNLLYTQSHNALYKIDLFNKNSAKILSAKEATLNPTFFIEGNDIFYIEQSATENVLTKYNSSFNTTKIIARLNKSNNYKFIKSTNNFLGLIDLDQQKLYLVKKTNTDLEINIQGTESVREFKAKDAIWDDKEKQLLYYDDFEISNFNVDENKEIFINRYGQEIKKISWYPDLEHFVMLLENKLEIIDTTQEVGTRNAIELVKFDEISNVYLDKKGENIYFSGKIGKQQGLYQLKLK